MGSTAQKVAAKKKNKLLKEGKLDHSTRAYNRCEICGRSRGYIRRFKICRLCFRQKALNGELPGVRKGSW